MSFTVITDEGLAEADSVLVAPDDLPRVIGWELKPQGLCRGEVCVPLLGRDVVVDGRIDLRLVADALRRPLAYDEDAGVGVLGASAAERTEQRAGMYVDDFALSDVDGQPFRWSSIGRKKKLLFAWASW